MGEEDGGGDVACVLSVVLVGGRGRRGWEERKEGKEVMGV